MKSKHVTSKQSVSQQPASNQSVSEPSNLKKPISERPVNVPHAKLISAFKQRSEGQASALTLGGTGPNGASQVVMLNHLGNQYVHQLDQVNLISGSVFSYFIWDAFFAGMLKLDVFAHFDKRNRHLHKASVLKGLKHLLSLDVLSKALYENEKLKQIVFLLFEPKYAERPLSSFNPNLNIWAFCSNTQQCHAITPSTHPDMPLWQAICATGSVPSLYGRFEHRSTDGTDHRFSDPNFSDQSRQLNRSLLQWEGPHIFMNFKKTAVSRNVLFLKNEKGRAPQFSLFADFALFMLNIPNRRIVRTHADALSSLRASLAASFIDEGEAHTNSMSISMNKVDEI